MENTKENLQTPWPPPWPTLDGVPIEEWVARKSRPRGNTAPEEPTEDPVKEIDIPDHYFTCFPDLDVLPCLDTNK